MIDISTLSPEEKEKLVKDLMTEQEPKEAPVSDYVDISLNCGFKGSIKKSVFKNYELLQGIAKMEKQPEEIFNVIPLMLGKDGEVQLCNCLRDEDGIVPIDKILAAVREIYSQVNAQVKNIKK